MEWDDIQRELLFVARNWPTQTPFTKDSSMDLARQIVEGVSRMVAENRTNPHDVAIARNGVRTLLQEMDAERRTLGSDVFTETTLANALGRLCPGFWPFC